MQMGFYFDQTRCTGCNACRVACKDWNDVPEGPESWMQVKYKEQGETPNVFVAYMIQTCFHCESPICAEACPAGAIAKRPEDGIVLVNQDACLGKEECGAKCLKACPYDAPQFGPEPGAKMGKCTFCTDRLAQGKAPSCVESCYTRALDFGPLDELRKKYGQAVEAFNFKYSARTKPSVVLNPKAPK